MSTETVAEADQTDVDVLAHRLGDAITDLPEYQRFVETQKAVQNSAEAQEKIAEFEQVREEHMQARQSGFPSPEDLQRLETVQSELNSIPEMAEHLKAQSQLETRLAALNNAISEPLAVDFGQNAGGCCQD